MSTLLIMPTIVMSLIIGIGNMIMMIKDETGSASSTIGHGASAIVGVFIFVFLSMNYGLVDSLIPALQNSFLGNEIVMRLIIGLIAAIYVHIHSGVFKGARGVGMHETWIHSFALGILVAAAPYIWPLIAGFMPSWLGGTG